MPPVPRCPARRSGRRVSLASPEEGDPGSRWCLPSKWHEQRLVRIRCPGPNWVSPWGTAGYSLPGGSQRTGCRGAACFAVIVVWPGSIGTIPVQSAVRGGELGGDCPSGSFRRRLRWTAAPAIALESAPAATARRFGTVNRLGIAHTERGERDDSLHWGMTAVLQDGRWGLLRRRCSLRSRKEHFPPGRPTLLAALPD
jgi:hypothetical protein